jgi:hypothetical protein
VTAPRIADLAVRVGEGLRAGDTLAVAQALADARAYGGRPAVLGALDAACVWLWRTGPTCDRGEKATLPGQGRQRSASFDPPPGR